MIDLIVGARPNFVKAAALLPALRARSYDVRVVHTGQHSSMAMSTVFFQQLGLPQHCVHLTIAGQPANFTIIMEEYTRLLRSRNHKRPDAVIVVGDVDSTLACALAAKREGIFVAHVEAGLRCGDPQMPEEINRKLTDAVSDLLFTSEPEASFNLRREGIPAENIRHVGNVMIDTLIAHRLQAKLPRTTGYVLVTLHRADNTDDAKRAKELASMLKETAKKYSVIFPMHPRTSNNWNRAGVDPHLDLGNTQVTPPLDYLSFLGMLINAGIVLTDSGGIQEETTFLRKPCITIRPSTERPITILLGTNLLMRPGKDDLGKVPGLVGEALAGNWKRGSVPALWDGEASRRVASVLRSFVGP